MQVYIRLDQPMAALEVYRTGLDKFPNEVTFLTGVARIYEAIGNLSLSAKYYKILLVVRMCNMRFPISTGRDILGYYRDAVSKRREIIDLAFIHTLAHPPPSKVIPADPRDRAKSGRALSDGGFMKGGRRGEAQRKTRGVGDPNQRGVGEGVGCTGHYNRIDPGNSAPYFA